MHSRRFALFASLLVVLLVLPARGAKADWTPMGDRYNGLFLKSLILPTLEYTSVVWSAGDRPEWARPDFDDSGWRPATLLTLPSHTGVYWLRFRVRNTAGGIPGGVYIQASMAYELFWDGTLVGRAGVPGTDRLSEKTGPLDNLFPLPDAVRGPGEPVVAMRVSNYWNKFPSDTMPIRFVVLEPPAYQAFNLRANVGPTLAIGALLMLAVTALVMWVVAARRWVLFLFAAMCVSAAWMQATLVMRFVFGYPYEWHYWVWITMGHAASAFGVLLVALLALQFALPRWTLILPFVPLVALGLSGPNTSLPVYLGLALLFALAAALLRRRGAGYVVAGLALTVLMWARDPWHLLSNSFSQYIVSTIIGLTIAVALDLRAERRKARDAQLAAARLEVEVLKRNIQPHFLLNTLATIMEVIERDPKAAVALIQALADEFRILARVSGEKLITLGQELALCRAHLDVMSRRKGVQCALRVSGIDEDSPVPPALFHTLIENGLTHLLPREGRLDFELRAETNAGGVRYVFMAHGERQRRNGAEMQREGTGLRYVKARLEESFTGQWILTSAPVPGGWETVIEIRAPSARLPRAEEAALAPKERLA